MDDKFNIVPLFSSPLAVIQVDEDCSNLKKIISDYSFKSSSKMSGAYNTFVTENFNILDNFPKEKNIILKYFNYYKNDFLLYKNQDFRMTTSWGTKTCSKGFSQIHNHTNSLYSGVFYFDDVDGGELQFESIGVKQSQTSIKNPQEINIFNCTSWSIHPQKNMLVFFPSYLYHRIGENNSLKDRYSLAFNFFPIGQCGYQDSFIEFDT